MFMMDIRYHIATLIAVFLALGVGILVGSTVVGSDVLNDQQKKMIDQLEKQFEVLRQKEEDLTTRVEFMNGLLRHYEDFTEALLRHEGDIGCFLRCVESSERHDDTQVSELLTHLGLSADDWNPLTLEAHRWMLGAIHDQQDAGHA